MKNVIEQIKHSIAPSRVIGSKIAIKPKGPGEYHGLCPFHKEKTPSFTVSDEKGFYHCFGCGAHGDIFTYIMNTEGLSYKDALERLANEAGVTLPKYSQKHAEEESKIDRIYQIFEITAEYYHKSLYTTEGKIALDYLRNRGLKDEIIKEYKLGYAPLNSKELLDLLQGNYSKEEIAISTVMNKGKNSDLYNMFRGRVMFPILNRKGKVIAFGGRVLSTGEPKYLNSPDNPVFKKGQELFGLYSASAIAYKSNEVILVEGYMDALMLINYGIENVVAPLGTAVRIEQIELLWKIVDNPKVCLDNDNAGRRAMAKLAIESLKHITPKKSLEFVLLEDAKDPDEYINKNGANAFRDLKANAISLSDFIFNVEKGSGKFSTPESRVEFKNRLFANSDTINDKSLSSTYKKYYSDKFFKLFNSKRKEVANINQSAIINATFDHDVSFETQVILNLLGNPKLLKNNEIFERLVEIEIESKELDNIRNYLLSIINSDVIKDEELNVLESFKVALYNNRQLKKTINSSVYSDSSSQNNLSEEEAKENILRSFQLISLRNLQKQIESTKKEVLSTSNDIVFVRLAELKKQEENIKIELGLL